MSSLIYVQSPVLRPLLVFGLAVKIIKEKFAKKRPKCTNTQEVFQVKIAYEVLTPSEKSKHDCDARATTLMFIEQSQNSYIVGLTLILAFFCLMKRWIKLFWPKVIFASLCTWFHFSCNVLLHHCSVPIVMLFYALCLYLCTLFFTRNALLIANPQSTALTNWRFELQRSCNTDNSPGLHRTMLNFIEGLFNAIFKLAFKFHSDEIFC